VKFQRGRRRRGGTKEIVKHNSVLGSEEEDGETGEKSKVTVKGST